jgi:putative aldouronate transport system permease protein
MRGIHARRSVPSRLFDAVNVVFMFLVMFMTLYPFWYALIGSLSDGFDFMKGGVYILPRVPTLFNFRVLFETEAISHALLVSVLRSLAGTVTQVGFTAIFAYAFSRKGLIGKRFYAGLGLFTMIFSGGLIPTYVLYKQLGLLNNFLVYIIPNLLSFWNVMIFSSFFREIPSSLLESARIDGAGEYRAFFSLIVPLSTPVIAAITLFVAVSSWNAYYDAMIFTTSARLAPMQLVLMRIIRYTEEASRMANDASADFRMDQMQTSSVTIQLAAMMVAAAPIMVIYPFLQKYFVKGVMIGSLKG